MPCLFGRPIDPKGIIPLRPTTSTLRNATFTLLGNQGNGHQKGVIIGKRIELCRVHPVRWNIKGAYLAKRSILPTLLQALKIF